MDSLLLVSTAGLLAGAMNALAGGGSFVSLPALIAAGVPPVQANASSTVALFPGGVASAWAYRDGLGPVGSVELRPLLIATLCGGFAGAVSLLCTSSTAFSFVLPWLLLIASLALAFGRRLGQLLRGRWHIHARAVLAVQFLLGIYGGYFGGAVGIMMIAMWGLLDKRDLKSLNAPRTLLVSAANAGDAGRRRGRWLWRRAGRPTRAGERDSRGHARADLLHHAGVFRTDLRTGAAALNNGATGVLTL
jgi:hypothetical protein